MTPIIIDWPAIKDTPGAFRIALQSSPNPDFGEVRARKPPMRASGDLFEVVQAAHAYRSGLDRVDPPWVAR